MINLSKIKKVHCIGIGGIAVSADAKFMLEIGKIVSGSDVYDSEIIRELQERGVTVYIGHKKSNFKKDVDLVIYSPAVPENNVERVKAKELGIYEMSHTEFIGFLSRKMRTITVSGTNGKSTTTSMLGLILEKAEIDPTVIVGSKVSSFKDGNLKLSLKFKVQNLKLNKDNLFVVEGCEYKAGMLELSPDMILLTNIEEDHLDFYKDLNHIKRVFRRYIKKVEKDGIVFYNMDDENSVSVLENFHGKTISYGVEELRIKNQELTIGKLKKREIDNPPIEGGKGVISDVIAKNVRIKNKRQVFAVYYNGKELGEIRLRAPGIFNVYNAMASIAVSLEMGVDFKIIKKSLEEFKGIWRRFEIIKDEDGIIFISDYAHHPTAVQNTIKAAREFYPNRRIVAVFQPHSHNRTLKLFTEFAKSFNNADLVILSEIYDVEGRENIEDKISSKDLVEAVRERKNCRDEAMSRLYGNENIFYAKDLKETGKILRKNIKKNDVVLIMGAGDIYKLKI